MPLDYVPMSAFTVEHTLPIPQDLKFHSVSPIQVDWDETPSSGFHSRNGAENHKTYDPGTARFPDVTFSVHCSGDESGQINDMFKKVGQGDLIRGDITVNVINPKDQNKPIITVTMYELTLASYTPPVSGNVENPGVLSVTFTIKPNRMELKTY